MSRPSHDRRVAVVIPVYRAQFLAEALESVFIQARQPDEVIVVNDGSPDESVLLDAVAPYAGRVRLFRQDNRGAGAARNRGIAATEAEFVAFLDADDRWLPGFLAHQLAQFDRQPALDVVYSDGLMIGGTLLAGRRFMAGCPSDGPVTLESLLDQRCTVLLSSVVARRAAIEAVGGFDETLRRGQDADLWFRMTRHGALIDYHRPILILRRVHSENLSGSTISALARAADVFEHALATHPLTQRERQIAHRTLRRIRAALARERGKELLLRGDFAAARRAIVEACREWHGWKLRATLLCLHVAPQLVRWVYQARREATLPTSAR